MKRKILSSIIFLLLILSMQTINYNNINKEILFNVKDKKTIIIENDEFSSEFKIPEKKEVNFEILQEKIAMHPEYIFQEVNEMMYL